MKKTLILFTASLFFSTAQAATFLGKIGPFYANDFAESSLTVKKCSANWSKLILAATANGKYSFPRFNYREITVEFASGKIQSILSSNEDAKLKTLAIKIPSGECAQKITMNATNSGSNPGRINVIDIEVWSGR